MDKLWAPWRMNYIKNNLKTRGCFFCQIKKRLKDCKQQKKNDKKNFVLLRHQFCFVVVNLFPYNNGHLMISPYRHIKDFSDLKNDEMLDLFKTTSLMKKILDRVLAPGGYNIGININKTAGAGLASHLHIHIVPRWRGDTNFMPVTSDTKVISQSLQELYNLLRKQILKIEK